MHLMYDFIDCYFLVVDGAKMPEVVENLENAGNKVWYCHCDTGSCANENICSFCYMKKSRRAAGEKPVWIVEKLR